MYATHSERGNYFLPLRFGFGGVKNSIIFSGVTGLLLIAWLLSIWIRFSRAYLGGTPLCLCTGLKQRNYPVSFLIHNKYKGLKKAKLLLYGYFKVN